MTAAMLELEAQRVAAALRAHLRTAHGFAGLEPGGADHIEGESGLRTSLDAWDHADLITLHADDHADGITHPDELDAETRAYLEAAGTLHPLDADTAEAAGFDSTGRDGRAPATEADRVVREVLRSVARFAAGDDTPDSLGAFLEDAGGWLAYCAITDDDNAATVAIRRIAAAWWVSELLNPGAAEDDHGPGCDGPLNCTCDPGAWL
jgi:hypothetical protein